MFLHFPEEISNNNEHVRKTFTTEEAIEGAKTFLEFFKAPLVVLGLAKGENRVFCDLLKGLRFTIAGRLERRLT